MDAAVDHIIAAARPLCDDKHEMWSFIMCISGNTQFNETDGRINTSAYIIIGHDVTVKVKVSIFQASVR